MLLLIIIMGLLGIGFALAYGFSSEKSLNNINQLSIWILFITPGMAIPSNSAMSPFLFLFFPKDVTSFEKLLTELIKLTFYLIVALYLIHKGCRPFKKVFQEIMINHI
ncbi:hypothetical protein [Xenorhabdus lircayensis]|uniref:Uncharacterized protein n=1 Tax=Xenorhabdus lircayensis TaxID=2763499 RepID=A0ABS0U699_9GAMM|nr:hypothetical protein [Xenorhabdus lircayensis]MBI6549407.1 hypothetical protein [Xenorhabdus lircayensis]